jgi:hypothetical protein
MPSFRRGWSWTVSVLLTFGGFFLTDILARLIGAGDRLPPKKPGEPAGDSGNLSGVIMGHRDAQVDRRPSGRRGADNSFGLVFGRDGSNGASL